MGFIPFFQRHDDIAKHETRAVTLSYHNKWNLPAGTYGLIESYCADSACDCRKAMIAVLDDMSHDVVATIGYGWESAAYYTKWMHGDSTGREMVGSYLEVAQQSPHSKQWLLLWKDMIASDEKYRERIRRHYRLFKNHQVDDDFPTSSQYRTPSPTPTLADAESELLRVLRLYEIEKYVSIDHVRTWCEKVDVDDENYMAPFSILMGLAAESEDASRETIEEVINALRSFWNSLPRKKLNGNSPDEAFARRSIQNEGPNLRSSVIEFGRWVPHYDKALKQLHTVGEEKNVLDEFRTVFQLLLEEHTTTRHAFRVFANAAVACFSMGDEYGGVQLFKIASEINPHYDFARDQLKRYTTGQIDDLIIDGITRRDTDTSEELQNTRKSTDVPKRRRTKNSFTHLRVMAALFGRLGGAKTPIPLAQIPFSKRDEREAKRKFEAEPWHAYHVFLKKFNINFSHPLEEPSEVTFHRTNGAKIGRNDPCPCGSGKKYKKCHG